MSLYMHVSVSVIQTAPQSVFEGWCPFFVLVLSYVVLSKFFITLFSGQLSSLFMLISYHLLSVLLLIYSGFTCSTIPLQSFKAVVSHTTAFSLPGRSSLYCICGFMNRCNWFRLVELADMEVTSKTGCSPDCDQWWNRNRNFLMSLELCIDESFSSLNYLLSSGLQSIELVVCAVVIGQDLLWRSIREKCKVCGNVPR